MFRLMAIAVLLIPYWLLPDSPAEPLRFAPLPMENRETIVKQFKPFTDYLSRRLKREIVYVYSDDYADILQNFSGDRVDLAYLGPLPYVELRAGLPHADPLVRFREKTGGRTYTCALVTFPDNRFDPSQTASGRFALTQPLSTCGFLSTERLLGELGISLRQSRFRYLGKHDTVALAVIRGEYDAGGVKTSIARKYLHLGLEVTATTPPLPGFVLVANSRTLAVDLREKIRKTLLTIDPQGRDRELLSSWGSMLRNGTAPAADSDYDVIRKMLGNVDIPGRGSIR